MQECEASETICMCTRVFIPAAFGPCRGTGKGAPAALGSPDSVVPYKNKVSNAFPDTSGTNPDASGANSDANDVDPEANLEANTDASYI